ncbi:hypothetical protein L1049_019950 [Liquidambar formosana]|uniref:SWIM-type domain-containing protein n=1 Tax=Liquidambar formosana TaxID=63359 RepID=A0AAP0X9I5_LIQFO
MYPIAYAMVEAETKDAWIWFLTHLFGDIGSSNHHKWCFISDQQKGLLPVFKEVAPTVEHRFCVRHLHGNFSKQHKGKQLKDAMWDAARATTVVDFKKEMKRIKDIKAAAYTYLLALQPNWWTRSAFNTFCKCDALLNNICESFNGYILEARDKPIIKMLEMDARTCSCRKWDLTGIPCIHAISAIRHANEKPEDYVHPAYTVETYKRTYEHMIYPVSSKKFWAKIGRPIVHPPSQKRPPGRPKKLRRREPDEPRDSYRVSKKHVQMRCGKCINMGTIRRPVKVKLLLKRERLLGITGVGSIGVGKVQQQCGSQSSGVGSANADRVQQTNNDPATQTSRTQNAPFFWHGKPCILASSFQNPTRWYGKFMSQHGSFGQGQSTDSGRKQVHEKANSSKGKNVT